MTPPENEEAQTTELRFPPAAEPMKDEYPMSCSHIRTRHGKNAPRREEIVRGMQTCLDCGTFRLYTYNDDPDAAPSWSKSAWRPASQYEKITGAPPSQATALSAK